MNDGTADPARVTEAAARPPPITLTRNQWIGLAVRTGLALAFLGIVLTTVWLEAASVSKLLLILAGVLLALVVLRVPLPGSSAPATTETTQTVWIGPRAIYIRTDAAGFFASFVTEAQRRLLPAEERAQLVGIWVPDPLDQQWAFPTNEYESPVWMELPERSYMTGDSAQITCKCIVLCRFNYTAVRELSNDELLRLGNLYALVKARLVDELHSILTRLFLNRTVSTIFTEEDNIDITRTVDDRLRAATTSLWRMWGVSIGDSPRPEHPAPYIAAETYPVGVRLYITLADGYVSGLLSRIGYGGTSIGGGGGTSSGGAGGERPHLNDLKTSNAVTNVAEVLQLYDHFLELLHDFRVDGVPIEEIVQYGISFKDVLESDLKAEGVDYSNLTADILTQLGIIMGA